MRSDPHGHHHRHDHSHRHGHTHGVVILAASGARHMGGQVVLHRLVVTAVMQVLVVCLSGSVALLADTIHNFGDAATAIPLYIAFLFAREAPQPTASHTATAGSRIWPAWRRAAILFSAVVAGYQAFTLHQSAGRSAYLWAVAAASVVGFSRQRDGVAIFRIRVGREIRSAALVADGYHARVDGSPVSPCWSARLGVWLGFPLADPIVGLRSRSRSSASSSKAPARFSRACSMPPLSTKSAIARATFRRCGKSPNCGPAGSATGCMRRSTSPSIHI